MRHPAYEAFLVAAYAVGVTIRGTWLIVLPAYGMAYLLGLL